MYYSIFNFFFVNDHQLAVWSLRQDCFVKNKDKQKKTCECESLSGTNASGLLDLATLI